MPAYQPIRIFSADHHNVMQTRPALRLQTLTGFCAILDCNQRKKGRRDLEVVNTNFTFDLHKNSVTRHNFHANRQYRL